MLTYVKIILRSCIQYRVSCIVKFLMHGTYVCSVWKMCLGLWLWFLYACCASIKKWITVITLVKKGGWTSSIIYKDVLVADVILTSIQHVALWKILGASAKLLNKSILFMSRLTWKNLACRHGFTWIKFFLLLGRIVCNYSTRQASTVHGFKEALSRLRSNLWLHCFRETVYSCVICASAWACKARNKITWRGPCYVLSAWLHNLFLLLI